MQSIVDFILKEELIRNLNEVYDYNTAREKATTKAKEKILEKYPNIKGGFIHVPYIPSQVLDKPNMPSMSAEDITKGLELCIKAAVSKNEDVKVTGGAIC